MPSRYPIVLQGPLWPDVVRGPDAVRDILHPDPTLSVGLLDDAEASRGCQSTGQVIEEARLVYQYLTFPVLQTGRIISIGRDRDGLKDERPRDHLASIACLS